MKTNTNTLRRALETFAKTGKITLTASALMALALSAPVNAAEKNFSESVIIEESTTVPAGDMYNYKVPEADAYNPIPGDLLEEPNSGLILNNGTLTIAGTANLTANFSSGSAVGDVSNLVIEKGGIFNVSRYSHMARHKDSVSNLTIEAGGTMNQTKSFYFGCRGESTADIYGRLNITDGNFHIGANYAYADETFRKNAVGIVTVHEGGVVTLTGSGRHISLGRFGSVNTTDKNVGILNIDGGTVTAPSISCADDSGLADKYTNTDYSHAEVNITNGGTLKVGSVTMPYGTGWIVVDGAGSALNVTDTINMYWKDLEVRNGGTVNATKVVSGGYAETAFILDGGTANISGTFTNNGKTANGGGLIIKNGGLLNLTGSNTIDGSGEIVISSGEIKTSDNTLALTGKTLNYSGGTLPETLNLTKTALNISNTADWNVENVKDTNGSTLSVAFTPDGTGTVLGSTTFTGFDTADVTLKFAEGVNNQRLTSYAMTADGKIVYETAAAKNLVLNRGTDILEADTLSGFASLQTGDVIDVTADITESKTVALPSGNLTIRSNSEAARTVKAAGNLFYTTESSTLKVENMDLIGAGMPKKIESGAIVNNRLAASTTDLTIESENAVWENGFVASIFSPLQANVGRGLGGAIYASGDLTISGSNIFRNNTSWSEIPNLTNISNPAGWGGAVASEGTLTLNGTNVFENNFATTAAGAIDASNVILNGNYTFTGNRSGISGGAIVSTGILELNGTGVFSGNSTDGDGGALYSQPNYATGSTPKFTINGNVTFENNTAGEYGGAIVSVAGMTTTPDANVTFSGNSAKYGGAIDSNGTVTIEGNVSFIDNTASERGGAINQDHDNGIIFKGDDTSVTFSGNTANGVNNDIQTKSSVTIQDKGTYSFGGGINAEGALDISKAKATFGGESITNVGSMDVKDNADVTFQSGAKLTVKEGATVNNATLNLEGGVDFDGTISMENTTANFTAGPGNHGFSTIKADSFSGEVNVDLNGFTVGANGDTVTLIDGAKAENVNITNGDLMTNANVDGKTAVTIKQDEDGNFGSASLADSKLVGIDFDKDQTSMTVKDFSLIVEGVDSEINLQDFADWLGDETGLETAVGTGYVSVRLDSPFEIMSTDSFIWDFSGFNGDASLQFVTANIMDNTVPEPTTWALLVLGGLGIFGIARKNRKAKK